MFAEPFEQDDGFRIWLDRGEADDLIQAADNRTERLAFKLGLRSGLRVSEIVDVEAKDVVDTSAGPRIRIWDSKGTDYRETPTTDRVHAQAETVEEIQGPEENLVNTSTRWVQRHLSSAVEELAEDGDDMWQYVTPHDLRRTWATLLSADIDDPLLIMDWGGWDDIETFLEAYRGSYSPHVQRRELEKVDWLDVGGSTGADQEPQLGMLERVSIADSGNRAD
jgi:integrase